ncbi:cysteine proteinase inhibitor 6-like [Panicum miliaceum]|uniref:Cysteine proteinase inhibitor 6-like n=1 Tax=Panicum miliaceum TaxID=4540 RepID=A0A3L6SZ82_PANMI|nr:cysteine proteinase inhibitor 6-like [Panicum miliaceum]
MTTCSLLVLAAAVVACAVVSPAAAGPYLCPWRTVAHVDDPFIQSLGKWAVEQSGAALGFDKVESARAQGVGECTSMTRNYDLVIDASNRAGAGGDKYRAVVFVMYMTQPQKLVSFERIPA